MSEPWRATDDGVILSVRLTPKGGRDRLDGVVVDADNRPSIKARVSAAPVGGAANVALIKLLAKELGVPKSRISFISGETARIKRLSVIGDSNDLVARLRIMLGV